MSAPLVSLSYPPYILRGEQGCKPTPKKVWSRILDDHHDHSPGRSWGRLRSGHFVIKDNEDLDGRQAPQAQAAEQSSPSPGSEEGQRLTRRRITAILRRDGRRLNADTITASRGGLFTVPAPGSVEWAHDVADGFTVASSRDRRWALSILTTPNAARAA